MRQPRNLLVRSAQPQDISAIARIYNQGVEDRTATLEVDPKTEAAIDEWLMCDLERYPVLVACVGDQVAGWAALRPYSHRCAHASTAELSIYIERDERGRGLGAALLSELERRARDLGMHKIVLFALPTNAAGQHLYHKQGFREVGIFREHGRLDGQLVDVMAMEKII